MKRFLWIFIAPLLATGTTAAQADECSAADVIVGATPLAIPFDTNNCTDTGVAATTSLEQQCFSYSADVWVQWTATFTGSAIIGTCNAASYDTEVGVWSGTACPTLAPLGCNDDAAGCAGLSSQIVVPVTSGTSYYVTVGYWTTSGVTGSGTLSIAQDADLDGDGFTALSDCDDTNPNIFPGAPEICGNGIDEDCSGADTICPPANDDCAGATALALGPNAVSTLGGTPSGILADPLPAWVNNTTADSGCQPFMPVPGELFNDTFYTFAPATTGLYLLSTCNMASYDSKLATYTGACGSLTATACNDDGDGCAGFSSTLFANLTGGTSYTVQVGAFATGQTGTATLDISTVVDMDGDGSPSFADCDDTNPLIFPGAPETCGNGIDEDCNGTDLVCPPANDDCAGATPLALGPNAVSTAFTTPSGILADPLPAWIDNNTADSGCQPFMLVPGDLFNDAFYTFAPATTGLYLLSTCNMASYDTKLATYSGACGSLTATACNDDGDGCAGFSSTLLANLTGGTSYTVQVGAFAAGQEGTATLDISTVVDMDGDGSPSFADCNDANPMIFPGAPEICGNGIDEDCNGTDLVCPPANSDCVGATPLTTGPNAVSTVSAAASGVPATVGSPWIDNVTPDTDCQDFGNGFNNLNIDTWYTFTPPNGGQWLFSTCNMASYDTKLAVHSGTCGAPTALACNDDGTGCTGFSSELRANLSGGVNYLVQVGAFAGGQEGTATLDISKEIMGGVGVNYCQTSPNAAGAGAIMSASGTSSIAANNLVLQAGTMSPGQPGIFYHGAGMPLNPAGISFGEGRRCVTAGGGLVVRMAPTNADGAGLLSYALDFNGIPNMGGSLMVGSRNFQAWFRDPFCVGATSGLAGDCNDDSIATGFNLSDGYTIVLVP